MMPNKEIGDDIKKYAALDTLRSSDGGKVLIDSYTADIIASLDGIAQGYRSMTYTDLVARAAGLSEKLDVLRTLLNARTNLTLANEALKEALLQEPEGS